jgi:hypothetical protein
LLVPRWPLLKEWAYAGALFVYTGAIVSHVVSGYGAGVVVVLTGLAALTVLSWALRPASRRLRALRRADGPVVAPPRAGSRA